MQEPSSAPKSKNENENEKLSTPNGSLENDYNNKPSSSSEASKSTPLPHNVVTPPSNMLTIYKDLLLACQEQADFFRDDVSEKGQRLYAALLAWQDFIVTANELVVQVEAFAHKYDFDECTPGNGYLSFINVTNACIENGVSLCNNLMVARNTVFFRKKYYMKEVEAYSQLLSSLCTCLRHLLILNDWSKDSGDLFANGEHSAEELFEAGDTINQYCFYGRCLGFQYNDSIRGVLRFISISMAGFSETFYANDVDGTFLKTTRSLWTGGKYLLNPELRARRIVNLSQNAKIDFCKAFWFLAESELMHKIPSLVGSSIKVNQVIEIPSEPLQLPRAGQQAENNNVTADDMVDIPVPSAHTGSGQPITVRVLSYLKREGMMGLGSKRFRSWRKLQPRSKGILFHCHGGGFVAQSSKSHELYLRDWAVALNTPIFSVDYSLAPEAPFPRAIEEVFYAYCWMLKNAEYLGTTAERVVLAGDSAGANLAIGVALKCIDHGVRIPDGLFLAYCPTLISFVPSPARLLCLMDPLLPFGFMMRCLRAYAAPSPEAMEENSKSEKILQEIRKAAELEPHYKLSLDPKYSVGDKTSRSTTPGKSPTSSIAENSKWEQIKFKALADKLEGYENAIELAAEETENSTENTFASASYHSQTVERTDLPSLGDDNSSMSLSLEDDSQPIEHYPLHTHKSTDSEQYIDRFVDSYIVDGSTEEAQEQGDTTNELKVMPAKTLSEENLLTEASRETAESLQDKFHQAINTISNTFTHYTQSNDIKNDVAGPSRKIEDLRNMDALIARSPSVEFAFKVPKDPFLSPYYASPEWLQQLPPTTILTVEMDPCLDDCVMFAKKLKRLNRPVTLDILKGLPHGFLNFTMLSNEALEGSKHCIHRLKELMDLSSTTAAASTSKSQPVSNNINGNDNKSKK